MEVPEFFVRPQAWSLNMQARAFCCVPALPELVVEQAKCFSYLPTARKRLDVAARLGVVGLEDWKPKDEQHPQPSKSVT